MGDLLQFPKPQGRFAASVDFFLEPDGTVLARLRDMPPSLIEEIPGEASDKMVKLAMWVMQGAENLAEQANALRVPEDV